MHAADETAIHAITCGYRRRPRPTRREALALARQRHGARLRAGGDGRGRISGALAPRIAAALDDPTADAAVLPTYMLAGPRGPTG